ncbi:putative drug exporter of the RND superfamily [Actinopolymorpha cephalotaxi]|uniref:Putative drug exporter of the RND superfamily n=1 Tax=Actinopolymorpha cephalotaxi TaxID=504797 RepID=A0A1I3BHP8_9ACTN|nr:MMPL family transporter [Actinopolymorpha cephalotaxi]NYH86385.1 RND superfamily putative drug exporter [Actinopolymorpha cephalotaxi]SFH61616.1 putative drug exporter of the RND superfamily [Actinopolymorpha cephalotaxi]
MLARWAGLVVRRRWWILSVAAALAVLAGVASTTLTSRLDQGGYDVPGSESVRANAAAAKALGDHGVDALAVYTVPAGQSLRDPATVRAVQRKVAGLPAAKVAGATGWWQQPAQLSRDGRTAAVGIRLRVTGQGDQLADWEAVQRELDGKAGATYGVRGLTVRFSGATAMGVAVNAQTESDLKRAELVSFPVLMVLLVVVFGGLVAACLPLVVGGIGIVGALGVLWVLSAFTDVSVFAMNIVTLLGLGLAIDYGLFMVSRFREELHTGAGAAAGGRSGDKDADRNADRERVRAALAVAMRTSGRTVLVSGLTVAAALSGLLVFPQGMLRSIGLGGIAAVVVAALTAVTVLPALLAVLGYRVDALAVPWGRRAGDRPRPTGRHARPAVRTERGWGRVGRAVMRQPALVAVVVIGALLLAGTPFLRAEYAEVDASVLPKGNPVRTATEQVRDRLPAASTDAAQVVLVGTDGRAPGQQAVREFAADVSAVPGMGQVAPLGGKGDRVVLAAQVDGDPQGEAAQAAVRKVRDLAPPAGVDEVLVGGPTASLVDTLQAIGDRLPWMLAVLAGAVLVLLFLAFGSVVVPVKAVVLSALSLTASFGAVVWIFQDGHLIGLLNTEAGPIDASIPVLMLAVLFGLSTDYELFLLSRIAEAYRAGASAKEAVVIGLGRTGGLISAAALLLAVVVGAFALSGLKFMKLIGLGMLIAIAVDATIVRGLLVPAVLALLGGAAWWAPRPLARLAHRLALEGPSDPDPDPEPGAAGRGPAPASPAPGTEGEPEADREPAGTF